MKNYKIKPSFVSTKGAKCRSNKTGIDFMIFILIFVELFCYISLLECHFKFAHFLAMKCIYIVHIVPLYMYFHCRNLNCHTPDIA